MADDRGATDEESDSSTDLLEAAEDLIGTEALWRGQILYAGVKLGLIDMLGPEPTTASDAAADLGLDRDRTYRLLRAMANYGVVEEDDHRRFAVTPLGELFEEDHPQSLRSDLLFNRSPQWVRSMLYMPSIVETGGPPGFVQEFGVDFFEYIASDPESSRLYTELMELAARDHPDQFLRLASDVDFTQVSRVCDVGGGRGHFLCHLLQGLPDLEGVVFDRPGVIDDDDNPWAANLGVADRCSFVGGDMFEEVPQADAYLLKWILHNWSDDGCDEILSTIHEAASNGARLYVLETLVPDSSASHNAKRLDITMMTQVGGRERTEAEYASLLDASGWSLEETRPLDDGPLFALVAAKG